MKEKKTSLWKSIIVIIFILLLVISASSYTAYLTYTGVLELEDLKFWDNQTEFDEQYQLFLAEEKHKLEIAQAEADMRRETNETGIFSEQNTLNSDAELAYRRLFDRETFTEIRPVIYTYTGIENISCKSNPGTGYTVCTLASGYQGTAVGFDEDCIVLKMSETQYAYAPKSLFTEGACFTTVDNGVDLRGYLPHAEYYIDFAAEDNITGRSLYPAIPLLETHAAAALLQAAEMFWNDGYTIVIRDAYRPVTAQYELWNKVKDNTFVVDPDRDTSWHNVGRAVDISLKETSTGEEVELPSPVYDFSPASFRSNADSWTTEAVNNVLYITNVMENAGFSSVDSMWWHYEFRWQELPYMQKNLPYTSLVYEPLC